MYMFGGEDSAGNVLGDVNMFDLTTSQWTAGASMPVTLTGHTAVLMSTEIYVFGGRISTSLLSNTVYIYNTRKYILTRICELTC